MKKLAFIFSVLPVFAIATSLHPDTFRKEVAPVLHALDVAIQSEGEVLKTDHHHPYTDYLIALPASVNTGSACTHFVGQETTAIPQRGGAINLRVLGATDPMMDACIAVMPMPVQTNLTVKMRVLTGGFVPADRLHYQLVNVAKSGTFSITLDIYDSKVTVKKVF